MRDPLLAARLPARLRRLIRDRRGVVALNFGLMLLPMLGAIGLAIDFGNIMTARTKAQMAADAAALQASGVARDLLKTSDGSASATATALAEGKKHGEALFRAHAVAAGLDSYTLNLTLTRNGQIIETRTDFSVETKTFVGKVFGRTAFGAVGEAVATSSMPTYSDVYLALDVSASMGIAGSRADMVKLHSAKVAIATVPQTTEPVACVFACHVVEESDKTRATQATNDAVMRLESNSSVAKRVGVTLRIDVLRNAVINMIAEAEKDADSKPIYRLALYTLGGTLDGGSWLLNTLSPLSDNFGVLETAARTIDIQATTTNPQGQRSYINEQLNALAGVVPTSKDGSSQINSKKYVFLITDGARDVPPAFGSCAKPSNSGRCTNGINPTYCKTLKDKGITVAVLYTTYIPVTDDPANASSPLEYWYKLEMVDNKYSGTSVASLIGPALEQCASPGWFYEASDQNGIEIAMKKMFEQTSQAPRLTN